METIRTVAQILLALATIVIAIVGAFLAPNIIYKLRQIDPKVRQAGGRPPKEQPKILWKILWVFVAVALVYPIIDFGLNKLAPEYKPIPVDQLKDNGAYIKILEINPATGTPLTAGSEVQFIILVEYYLPGKVPLAEIGINYMIGSKPNKGDDLFLPTRLAAQEGKHTVQLAGLVKPPDPLALNGKPFEVGVYMEALDIVQRKNFTVDTNSIIYPLSPAK
ncbi:MAG TPA: hypothetical protein VN456_18095 [Desulfosporosinus sp.]|nr:hypothetical protein [Desulfosporosinus sp.]